MRILIVALLYAPSVVCLSYGCNAAPQPTRASETAVLTSANEADNSRRPAQPREPFIADSNTVEATITSLCATERTVKITWADGHSSVFHNVWLRDNCACHLCGDHSGGHRLGELQQMPDDLSVTATVSDEEPGTVALFWHADGHSSRFRTGWLRAHCNSPSEREKRRRRLTLWDKTFSGQVPSVDYAQMLTDDCERLRLYDSVRQFGIVRVCNVPPDGTDDLAAEISIVRETHYGRSFEIHSIPNAAGEVIANSGKPLRPHVDEGARLLAPKTSTAWRCDAALLSCPTPLLQPSACACPRPPALKLPLHSHIPTFLHSYIPTFLHS